MSSHTRTMIRVRWRPRGGMSSRLHPVVLWVPHCVLSCCTPAVADDLCEDGLYGPIVTAALASLLSQHELSQDVCVIGPVDPSGDPLWAGDTTLIGILADRGLNPETDIRVVPHCVMREDGDIGYVEGPGWNEQVPVYFISWGYGLMVQTYALDIMALATWGRMTPLRLWHLAMKQGFNTQGDSQHHFEGVDYGAIVDEWGEFLNIFPGFIEDKIGELEGIGDVELVEERLVHRGCHWLWMPPDRFPTSPTEPDHSAPARRWMGPGERRCAIESLPSDALIYIVSSLPLLSVLNLANTSQSLRTAILGNDYLACFWLYRSAPWWIPVPTQTPKRAAEGGDSPITLSQVFLASGWSEDFQLSLGFPTGLNWAYVTRCARSGSMRNRERIWNTVLDIERVADLAGV